jgi:sodium/potassium-transporting ATPase subunit alpha
LPAHLTCVFRLMVLISVDLLTEVAPAISFAWEPAEANAMLHPPRDRQRDRLVRPALLAYAYLQAGVVDNHCTS